MTIQTYITNLCQHCGIEAETLQVEQTDSDDKITIAIEVTPEDSGLLIGYHGETLASIQRLARVVFQAEIGEKKLIVNVNNYREQRSEKILQMLDKAAQRVIETGRPYTLSHLPSHERFLVHSTLAENPDYAELESFSEGEEPHRVLVIRLKGE